MSEPPAAPDLATYRLVVEYDGSDFCGFQFQPALRTVAGTLERALSGMFDAPVKVTVAGRTDAGVHATGQVVSFHGRAAFPVERLAIALNSALPGDVTVHDAARVADGFSARHSALERFYTYVVFNARTPSALLRRSAHFEYRTLDLERMAGAAQALLGTHDFVSFCGVPPEGGGTVRTLHALDLAAAGSFVRLHFRGDGFLHRMVRIVTGTLLEIGAGRRDPESLPAVLAARDRRVAGPTAPPQGLYLVGVRYADFCSLGGGPPAEQEVPASR
jgi:tRNA pseudouridine38-40 synthase